jgi:hypothetical protein
MAEDDEALAERGAGGGEPHLELRIRQAEVRLRERLALVEAGLFVVSQQRDVHDGFGSGPNFVKSFANLAREKRQIPHAPRGI